MAESLWNAQLKFAPLMEADEFAGLQAKSAAAAKAAAAQGGAEPKKKFKWATSADSAFKFNHKTAHACANLNEIDWKHLQGLERSDKGSEGLFFCALDGERGCLVVKRSKALGSELYCTMLALRLGISSPKMRIIDTNGEEGVSMLHSMKAKDPSGRVRSTLFEQHFLLALEYIPSRNCNDIDYSVAREMFGPENEFTDAGRERLQEIGAMLALDVLVNNCDRLPLIWSHRGNPGNIIFARDGSKAYSIDGQIIGIDKEAHKDEYDGYMGRVDQLLKGMKAGTAPEFDVVRDKFKEWTEYDVGDKGCAALQKGFEQVVEQARAAGAVAALQADLDQWAADLATYEPTLSDLPQIKPSFVIDVWKKFSAH